MLREIASLLSTAKGAAAATLIAGSAVTGGTVATVPEAREAVTVSVAAATTTLGSAVAAVAKAANERRAADTTCGKPEQVAQRNEADKQLRDAFHDDHRTLTDLKGGKAVDHQKVNAVVKQAQEDLRSELTVALVNVARETQGRTGQVAKANAAAESTTTTTTTTKASPSPLVTTSETLRTAAGGTVACAETAEKPADVTLKATLAAIVKRAIANMDAIVVKATADAALVPPAEHGKPVDEATRGNKPSDTQKGQPEDKPGGKPGGKPGTPPGRAR